MRGQPPRLSVAREGDSGVLKASPESASTRHGKGTSSLVP